MAYLALSLALVLLNVAVALAPNLAALPLQWSVAALPLILVAAGGSWTSARLFASPRSWAVLAPLALATLAFWALVPPLYLHAWDTWVGFHYWHPNGHWATAGETGVYWQAGMTWAIAVVFGLKVQAWARRVAAASPPRLPMARAARPRGPAQPVGRLGRIE